MKPKYSFIKSYFFAIEYLCLKSCPLSSRGLKPFWRRPSTHVCVCVFWFISRSGLVQRCSYSIATVETSFLHPRKYPSLTLKTNLLLLALSRFRMRLLRVCLAFRFSHSFPLSLPRNLCLAAPLQTLECQEGRGDRFDSNRTMKRTWSNYFQNRVYLGPLLFTLFLSLSAPSSPHFSASTMKLANLKGFECLVNDFVNTGERDLERRRGREGVRKGGEKRRKRREKKKKGQGADIKIPRVV